MDNEERAVLTIRSPSVGQTPPTWKHDCTACAYVGGSWVETLAGRKAIDVYVCPQMGMPTIVYRYGHDGPDTGTLMPMLAGDQAATLLVLLHQAWWGYGVGNVEPFGVEVAPSPNLIRVEAE